MPMQQRKVCPRCRNIAHLIGTRFYCHCGWNQKVTSLSQPNVKAKNEPFLAEAHNLSQRRN